MAQKESRCWPGYEPVEGKAAHSKGSCKPKPESKNTPSEKTFRAKRKTQLDNWEKEHPGSKRSAAQHLKSPTSKAAKTTSSKKSVAKKPPAKKKTARKRSN